MKRWLPWLVTGVCALWIISALRPARSAADGFAVQEFGRLPLVSNGRFQPVDSLARNSLLQLREKQSLRIPEEKRSLSATEWLMEVWMNPERADTRRAFRVDHPELKSMLKLPEKAAGTGEDGKHYTWNQIKPSLGEMESQARRVSEIEASRRNTFEQAVMRLQSALFLYMRLKNTVHPENTRDFAGELAEYQRIIQPGVAAFRSRESGADYNKEDLETFTGFVSRFDVMVRMDTPLLVPPHHPERSRDDWMRMGEGLLEVIHGQPLHFAVPAYARMASAYRQGRAADFNAALGEYQKLLAPSFGPELSKASSEHYFNALQTFYKSMVLYVLAFLLASGSWFNLSDALRRSAVGVIFLAFLFHTTGLLFRMVLEGRPPVTNLYSSAIFIGWGSVVLGLVLERFYRDGIGAVVASAMGFITLVIAHNLSLGGDTMEMMQAVLDTNFWLATHVVIVTLGYASTYVAGFLAIVYIIRGLFTKGLTQATGKALARMVYGIICFATLFSFVGTVLGGIWADQSWGRFWGWDPKENGALIIVLWNALILHARWGGMVRERGLMNLAIVGNIVTSWSWFGVNMLGIGLHSYGFMGSTFNWLMLFVISQLVLIGLGSLPLHLWASFRQGSPASTNERPVRPRGGKTAPAAT